jgi:hypothetical protein
LPAFVGATFAVPAAKAHPDAREVDAGDAHGRQPMKLMMAAVVLVDDGGRAPSP